MGLAADLVDLPGRAASRGDVLGSPDIPDTGADLRPRLAGGALGKRMRTDGEAH